MASRGRARQGKENMGRFEKGPHISQGGVGLGPARLGGASYGKARVMGMTLKGSNISHGLGLGGAGSGAASQGKGA